MCYFLKNSLDSCILVEIEEIFEVQVNYMCVSVYEYFIGKIWKNPRLKNSNVLIYFINLKIQHKQFDLIFEKPNQSDHIVSNWENYYTTTNKCNNM